MADLAAEHGAWLHVDGAFGLFARLTPQASDLAAGIERADSVIADGHKWLNVPYDCGFAFVRDAARLPRSFNVGAPYLPSPDDPRPNPGFLSPENSRRARALAVWATLRAYGRNGHREMVERHLELARHLASRVDASPVLERLADVKLNIVCFRAHPDGVPEASSTSSTRSSARSCCATAASSPGPPPTRAGSPSGPRSSTGAPASQTSRRWSRCSKSCSRRGAG